MTYFQELLLVIGMFAVTYPVRYLPFAHAHRLRFPGWLEEALSFVPVAALTAIIAPIILFQDHQLSLDWHNTHLMASIVAFAVAWVSRSLFMTVIFGLVAFFVLKWFT
jgi:branched-subunit amino acid transport protein